MNNRNILFRNQEIDNVIVEGPDDYWKEKCRRNFPREFRRLSSIDRGWDELHMELIQSSESNLSDEARNLFRTVRNNDAESFTDEDIQHIYGSLFVRDGLGYELIELCDPKVMNRLYSAVVSKADSDYSRLNLMILFNKPKDIDSLLTNYIKHFSPEEDGSGESRKFMKKILVNGSTVPLPFDLPLLSPDGDVASFVLANGILIETPLQLAAKYGRWEIARVLLNHGADVMGDAFYRALSKVPVPVDIAVTLGHEEMTKDLLIISSENLRAIMPHLLEQVVQDGDWRMSEVILDSGVLNGNANTIMRMSRMAFDDCHACYRSGRSREMARLSESLRALQKKVLDSDLQARDKLFIATKTLGMMKIISSPDNPKSFRQAAINEFYIATSKIVPIQSDLSRLLVRVVSAAIGLVVGAVVGATLGLGLVGVFATGSLCGAGAALFAQKVLLEKSHAKEVRSAANRVVNR